MRIIIALFALLIAVPANAAENMKLEYEIAWGGFTVGKLKLDLKENGNRYDYVAELSTQSIAKRFLKYWSVNTAGGTFNGVRYKPSSYLTKWNFKKEYREITLHYKDGKLMSESTEPVDNRGKFPVVAVDVKQNSVDPVTTGVLMRKKTREVIEGGAALPHEFVVETFDGRRKFDSHFQVKGRQVMNIDGKTREVIHVHAFRRPVAGFSENELRRMKSEDDLVFDIYLDPKSFIPVWTEGDSDWGTATFTLTHSEISAK